ncbi:hypothetical protein CALVIDRAFT_598023 [Calocera viscosa TUFC12733]|uniref:Uncharacterized protein n=1 Tax=Calocera viscosa (strain TUFC12733) TaxID=1330018 RepID=A0A167MNA6_CALVF|nr:hypothetical protein CALVIDRAFT_598023 [Calocera viscosa TUFC12733]
MEAADFVYAIIEEHCNDVKKEKEQLEHDIREKTMTLEKLTAERDAAISKLSDLDSEQAKAKEGLQAAQVARAQFVVSKKQLDGRHVKPKSSESKASTASSKTLRDEDDKKCDLTIGRGLGIALTSGEKIPIKRKRPSDEAQSKEGKPIPGPKRVYKAKANRTYALLQMRYTPPPTPQQTRKSAPLKSKQSGLGGSKIPSNPSDLYDTLPQVHPSVGSANRLDKLESSQSTEQRAESLEL